MILLALAKVDLCSMPNTQWVYSIEVEELVTLYAFYDTAKNPPAEYAKLALDIEAELLAVRTEFTDQTEATAYSYFSALSGLFNKLKDPHTLFVKPSFFKNFRKHLPFTLVERDGFWFIDDMPAGYEFVQEAYAEQDFTQNFSEMFGKRVYQLSGMSVDEYVLEQTKKYCYHSKSEQACFNSYIGNDMYYQNLYVYNLPDVEDQSVRVTTIEGETYMVQYVITTLEAINSTEDALKLYNDSLAKPLSFDAAKQRLVEPTREIDLNAQHLRVEDEEFEILQEGTFFTLYEYKEELLLAIESFSPDYELTGIKEMLPLMQYLRDNKSNSGRLYITVVGNGGGYVTLGHLLSFMMFPNEYPIYGRYNVRKSRVFELLTRAFSNFEDMHRTDWISGETITDYSLAANYTPSSAWYYQGDANETIFYAFDDDEAPWLSKLLDEVYRFEGINYNPEDIILITDGLCGSTCACFTKHLLQLGKIRAVGIGGTGESADTFDVSSFAGGTVQDSRSVESAVEGISNSTEITKEELEYLETLKMPHDGYFRFAHEIIYSFDTLESPGVPLEFRTFPVEYIIKDVHPFFGDFEGPTGIKTYIDKVFDYVEKPAKPAFGSICSVKQHIEYREFEGECVPHSCEYGYYKVTDAKAFKCVIRSDEWSFYTPENDKDLTAGEIAAIVILACACLATVILVICFLLRPQWFKCGSKQKSEEADAFNDNFEEL